MIVHGPGEGTEYSVRGSAIVFKAMGRDTAGVFSFLEREVPPDGRMPPAHTHDGPEAFYVLEGALEFRIGGDVIPAAAGAFVLVQGGESHTFGNTSDAPARLLTIHAPAADRYFAEMHELWAAGQPPTSDEEREVQRRHGLYAN